MDLTRKRLKTALPASSTVTVNYVTGDVNGDGVIDIKDVNLLSQYLAGKVPVNFISQAADINGDSIIDNTDLDILTTYVEMNTTIQNDSTYDPDNYGIGFTTRLGYGIEDSFNGDCNNDGKVDEKDYILFNQYLAGYNVTINYVNAIVTKNTIDARTDKPKETDLLALDAYLKNPTGDNPYHIKQTVLKTINNYIIGDANNDGKVDTKDRDLISNYLYDSKIRLPILSAADIDEDGEVTKKDLKILEYYLFKRQPFYSRINTKNTDILYNENIFKYLKTYGAPWSDDINDLINRQYIYKYGDRYTSTLLDYYTIDSITVNTLKDLAQHIYFRFGYQWNRLYKYFDTNYNVIDNYDKQSEITTTDTGTNTTTLNVQSTEQGTNTATASTNNDVYAFNSANASPLNESAGTTTNNNSVAGSTDTTGTNTTQNTNTITEHTHGNIGVSTAADMMSKDKEFWINFDFFNQVFKDINTILTLNIY